MYVFCYMYEATGLLGVSASLRKLLGGKYDKVNGHVWPVRGAHPTAAIATISLLDNRLDNKCGSAASGPGVPAPEPGGAASGPGGAAPGPGGAASGPGVPAPGLGGVASGGSFCFRVSTSTLSLSG
jgi:hypothetical protein